MERRKSARAATTEKHKAERQREREREAGRITFGRHFAKTYQRVSQEDPSCEWIRKDSTNTLIDLRKFFEDDRQREVRRGKWEAVEKRRRRVGTYDGF